MRRFLFLAGLLILIAAFYRGRPGSPIGESPPTPAGGIPAGRLAATPVVSAVAPPRITLLREPAAITPRSAGIVPPRLASFEQIAADQKDGKAWFQLVDNPRIYVLGYESLATQGRALNRIAALVEWREAPKDRVLDDRALAELLERTSENPDALFFGHDYRATELARFFTLARRSGLVLNEEEQILEALLLGQGLLQAGPGGFRPVPPEKVLIAIPGEQADRPETPQNEAITPRMRRTILSHEISHGEFFTNPDYARYCAEFWRNSLSPSEREGFTRFLSTIQHYDAEDEGLLINEFQAYLAYSGLDGIFFRYDAVPGIEPAAMKALRQRFIEGSPATFRPPLD